MSERTFRDKKHEERVSAALDKGRAVAEANVGKALYTKAVKGDITATRWWETTRAGRSERQIIRYLVCINRASSSRAPFLLLGDSQPP